MPSNKSIMALLAIFPFIVPMVAAQAHPYPSYYDKVVLAHGVMGALVWVVLMPLGGIIIRLCNFRGVFWAHTAIQLLAYSMFCAVFAMGCWFSWLYGSFLSTHVIIGCIVFGLATIQPFLGTLHHRNFKKYGRRTFASVFHIHLGRAVITIAMINGGLGLELTGDSTPAQLKTYGVIAGIIWLSYIITVSFKETINIEKYYQKADVESLDGNEKRNISVVSDDETRQASIVSDDETRHFSIVTDQEKSDDNARADIEGRNLGVYV